MTVLNRILSKAVNFRGQLRALTFEVNEAHIPLLRRLRDKFGDKEILGYKQKDRLRIADIRIPDSSAG
jgi:hypothetical protein